MNCFANMRADAPVEQLLFTLNTGTPVMPISYKALCPLVESPENVEGKWILFNFDWNYWTLISNRYDNFTKRKWTTRYDEAAECSKQRNQTGNEFLEDPGIFRMFNNYCPSQEIVVDNEVIEEVHEYNI